MADKLCKRCNLPRALELFNRNRRKPDGLDIYCKACCKLQQAASYAKHREDRQIAHKRWREKNPGKIDQYAREWQRKNPEKVAAAQSRYYRRNREALLEADRIRRLSRLGEFLERERLSALRNADSRREKEKRWRAANPHKMAAYAAARRAALAARVPVWLTDQDYAAIDSLYAEAARLSVETGVQHHVDHELPLRGRYVSGLHVPANLRVLPAASNLRKSNIWNPE